MLHVGSKTIQIIRFLLNEWLLCTQSYPDSKSLLPFFSAFILLLQHEDTGA
jgi:hypothetical protein